MRRGNLGSSPNFMSTEALPRDAEETADEIFRAPEWKEASSTFRSGK
jgi:hypothetical protein